MPSLPPPRTTELFYSGAWHDISGSMLDTSPVTITRGVSAEGNQPDPMAATAVLDNRSGDYSPRNPHSALYGLIGRNTPWKFSVNAGGPRVELSGTHDAVVTPGTGMGITGDIDIRVDITQTRTGIVQHVAGRYAATGNQRSWALSITYDSYLQLQWSANGTAVNSVTSTEPLPLGPGRRTALRVTLDVNNGAGGRTAQFYYSQSLSGPWKAIGEPVVTAGTTSILAGTAQLEFGSVPDITWQGLGGQAHALQLRNGIDGTLLVNLDVAARGTAGATTVTDADGRVWTVRDEAYLSNTHVRMVGEVPAWPPERDLSGLNRTVAISPAGIMRRLGVGNKPLDSALRRFIVGNPAVLDCWPMTDGPQSQRANSLMGGTPLMPLGDSADQIKWGKGDLGDWLEPVAAITRETAGAFKVNLARTADAENGWSVDCVRAGDGVDTGMTIIDYGAGSISDPRVHWTLVSQNLPDPDSLLLFADVYADDNVDSYTLTMLPGIGLQDGQPHHLRLETSHSGGSTTWFLYMDGQYLDGGIEAFYARPPKSITYEWNENFATTDTADLSVGYLTYWGEDAPFADEVYAAYRGFIGERAGTRVLRVAAERGVPATMYGREEDSTLLGVQRPEKFLDTLNTIARTDLGYVLEERDALALVYRGRHTLYNQAPVATLDWSAGVIAAPFKPTDDDKLTRNDVTVKRDGGVESTAVLESGPMSVLDPPAGVGRYDAAHTLSLAADEQTGEHAYWRMHLGTHDGLRYTKVTVNLGNPRGYALIDQLYRADVGDLLRLTNLPAEYGGGSTDLLIRGYTEEIGADGWTITFTCDPGAPWTVGVVGDPVLGRAGTDGTELADAVTSSQTMLPIVVTAGPEWFTTSAYPAEFPFDVAFGGEQATVTAITGTAEDAFGRTVASGWGTADSGQAWTSEGGSASAYAVTSGTGRHLMPQSTYLATLAPVVTPDVDLRVDFSLAAVPTGDSAYIYPVIRYIDATHFYMARVQISPGGAMLLTLRKRDGSESLMGSQYTTGLTYTAGAWYTVRLAMTGSTVSAKVWLRSSTEPASWQVTTTDTALTAAGSVGVRTLIGGATTNTLPLVAQFDNLYVGPRAMTVVRAVNGITKAHDEGTDLRLAHPTIVAL